MANLARRARMTDKPEYLCSDTPKHRVILALHKLPDSPRHADLSGPIRMSSLDYFRIADYPRIVARRFEWNTGVLIHHLAL
jgi:hypothetical protein